MASFRKSYVFLSSPVSKLEELGFDETFRCLIAALDTDLEWVRQHTRLTENARNWESKKRDNSFLLHGTALQEAIEWLAKSTLVKQPKPLRLQEEYIRASQKWAAEELEREKKFREHERREKKFFRRFSVVLGVALLLALLATAYASWQRDVARARELVSTSMMSQNADPQISVLTAAQAVAATWGWGHVVLPVAQQRLHEAIEASHVRLTLRGHGNSVNTVAWSPDGKRLATASGDRTAKVWDAATGLRIDDPVFSKQYPEPGCENLWFGEWAELAVELKRGVTDGFVQVGMWEGFPRLSRT